MDGEGPWGPGPGVLEAGSVALESTGGSELRRHSGQAQVQGSGQEGRVRAVASLEGIAAVCLSLCPGQRQRTGAARGGTDGRKGVVADTREKEGSRADTGCRVGTREKGAVKGDSGSGDARRCRAGLQGEEGLELLAGEPAGPKL